jgi:hypothetical protein
MRSGVAVTVRFDSFDDGVDESKASLDVVASERLTVASTPNDDDEDGEELEVNDGSELDAGADAMASTAAMASAGALAATSDGATADPTADDEDDPPKALPKALAVTRRGPGSVSPITAMAATASATGL